MRGVGWLFGRATAGAEQAGTDAPPRAHQPPGAGAGPPRSPAQPPTARGDEDRDGATTATEREQPAAREQQAAQARTTRAPSTPPSARTRPQQTQQRGGDADLDADGRRAGAEAARLARPPAGAGFGDAPERRVDIDLSRSADSPASHLRSREGANLRSRAEVESAVSEAANVINLPADMPSFWPIEQNVLERETYPQAMNRVRLQACEDISTYCSQIGTGPPGFIGAHGVRKSGGVYEQSGKKQSRGTRYKLVCSCEGKPSSSAIDLAGGGRQRERPSSRTGCQWTCWLEHVGVDDGEHGICVMELSRFQHNHELATTAAEKASTASTRDPIPAEYFEKATIWASRVPLSSVVAVLKDEYAKEHGKTPDWSIKDFANKLLSIQPDKTLDVTTFLLEITALREQGVRARLAAPRRVARVWAYSSRSRAARRLLHVLPAPPQDARDDVRLHCPP